MEARAQLPAWRANLATIGALIVRARNDQAERAKIMKEFGQQKAIQISLKFAGVMKKVSAECGFDPNKR